METASKHIKEKYFFWLVILLNLIPLFQGPFMPTMDGAAHLYNSNIILEKLAGNELMNEYFIMNSEWVPNWSGHFILAFFNSFLPAYVAEKIFFLIYLIGLPLAFRYFLKSINPKGHAYLLSYFILPFCYSFMLLMGFYNFSMAILFFFLSGAYWFQHKEKLDTKKLILFAFLLIATYFSHLVVFGLLIFSLGLYSFWDVLFWAICEKKSPLEFLKNFWSKTWRLLIAGALPLILALIYFLGRSENQDVIYLEFRALVDWLKELRPLIMYHEETEGAQTKKLVYLFAMLVIVGLFQKFNRIQVEKTISIQEQIKSFFKQFVNRSDIWLVLSLIVLFLYFKMPDGAQGAGFISVRLAYIFFLFLLVWIAIQNLPKWFLWFNIICMLYLNYKLNDYYKTVLKDLNKTAIACTEVSEEIEENTVVLPINRSPNWVQGHFSNYLGIDKAMIILENYEATTDYFPVQWNYPSIPKSMISGHQLTDFSCIWYPENGENREKEINYVFVLGRLNTADPCDSLIRNALNKNYHLIKQNEFCELYGVND